MVLKLGQTSNVDYPLIHWFHDLNSRVDSFGNPLIDIDAAYTRENGKVVLVDRPKGDGAPTAEQWKAGLVQLLAGGWNGQQGNVTVEEIGKAQIPKAIAERKAQIAKWKESKLFKLADMADRVWFPKGKAVEPLYVANDHYRRGYSIMAAIMRRNEEGLGTDYPLLCTLAAFVDEKERIIAHAQENDKEGGRSLYTWKDKLQNAYRLKRALGTEADVNRMLGGNARGTAQQLYRLLILNSKVPSVKLYERCLLPTPDTDKTTGKVPYKVGEFVNGPTLGKEEIKAVLEGKPIGKDKPTFQPDAEGVEAFVKYMMVGKKNDPKIMDKATIETMSDDGCRIVALVAKAILRPNETAHKQLLDIIGNDDKVAVLNDAFDKLATVKGAGKHPKK